MAIAARASLLAEAIRRASRALLPLPVVQRSPAVAERVASVARQPVLESLQEQALVRRQLER